MQLDGALVREQGVTFAVVVVKRHASATSPTRGDSPLLFNPPFWECQSCSWPRILAGRQPIREGVIS